MSAVELRAADAPGEAPAEVCIVGAGSSGLVAAKALAARDVPFDCFEMGSRIGGMWRYENDNGMSSAYRSLHIDTSRKSLGYPDFPIPDDRPDFLSHGEVLAYLEAYARRFDLERRITFRTEVTRVEPVEAGTWRVHLADGAVRHYRAVVVANGHLWDPRRPDFPGRFDGTAIHSHDYRTADPFADRDVLVVGIGNSAVDIAVDLCRRARSVHLSSRRGAWIMPKYIMGVPTDRWTAFLTRRLRLPTEAARAIVHRIAFLAVGNQARYGMPRPAHPIWREHATISQELLAYLGHGWIRMKPNVRTLDGDGVVFEDGSRLRVDAIVYATGYRTTFPFIDPALFQVGDGDARLYRRMHPPDLPGLFFVGLVQPIGPTIPLAEIQGRWLARHLSGELVLPDRATMEAEIDRHRARIQRTYLGSPRYTLEVDFRRYSGALARDIRTGLAGG